MFCKKLAATSVFTLICFVAGLVVAPYARALTFTPADDPQYVVMNFSTINELNWAVPEDEWQKTVKPQVLEQINELRTALPARGAQHKLAWSTLMEYMNFPLDMPSANSPYAIKMRRILEIADEENLPIFVPLNGFQWWDQLPELYNWWDPDGTHTDPKFFARQKNPEDFKQRFIAGYDPNNKWNVEWQDWQTPMQLNYRNWGGGGFRLAPPPNLSTQLNYPNDQRPKRTYRQVQWQRLNVILQQLTPFLEKWQKEGRTDLFAGLTIGTEVSLNASVKPADEFLPYGYRDVQDVLCDPQHPSCGVGAHFSAAQIAAAREQSVNRYLVDLTHVVESFGIPKQRVYTHVWSEAKKGEPRHVDYAAAAATLYARPGMSFYGYAQDPLSLPDWAAALKDNGESSWGASEYSAGTSQAAWQKGLKNIFSNALDPAHVMVIYNWSEHKGTGAIPALKSFLSAEVPKTASASASVTTTCSLPEIFPADDDGLKNPSHFAWTYLSDSTLPQNVTAVLHIKQGGEIRADMPDVVAQKVPSTDQSVATPALSPAVYSWYVETVGCGGQAQLSEPKRFVIVPPANVPKNPDWVDWVVKRLPF